VLGRTFSDQASLDTVLAALDALAAHPATARHLAGKFARHFVADMPDPGLVAALEASFLATGGDLLAMTGTLLDHPAAWAPERAKVLPPLDYLAAALRALGVAGADVILTDLRESRRFFQAPLLAMGQPWEDPPGPDGWPDDGPAWVTPQFIAARIEWAMRMPERLLPALPDPREFVETALGPAATEEVRFAASAAETQGVGVGVTLASALFNRR
jgi:uncharacterized protein (DUF1800 family)